MVVVSATFVFVVIATVLLLIVKSVMFICRPNEVLIFSGRRQEVNGQMVGFRVVLGGRAYRVPLLENVDRMDLTNMEVEVKIQNAYSKGGIPLNVEAIANVKISDDTKV